MIKKNISAIAITALCSGLISCGGGSSDAEPAAMPENPEMVLNNEELDASSNPDLESNTDETEANNENDDTDSDIATVLTGVFVDSAVEGASYTTASRSGMTNSAGEFAYIDGELDPTTLPITDVLKWNRINELAHLWSRNCLFVY